MTTTKTTQETKKTTQQNYWHMHIAQQKQMEIKDWFRDLLCQQTELPVHGGTIY